MHEGSTSPWPEQARRPSLHRSSPGRQPSGLPCSTMRSIQTLLHHIFLKTNSRRAVASEENAVDAQLQPNWTTFRRRSDPRGKIIPPGYCRSRLQISLFLKGAPSLSVPPQDSQISFERRRGNGEADLIRSIVHTLFYVHSNSNTSCEARDMVLNLMAWRNQGGVIHNTAPGAAGIQWAVT